MGVTFLHTADLHLGSPLRAVEAASESLAERLQRATHEAFRRVIQVALDEDVDFVVVSGDLYDQKARSVYANEFLVNQFKRLEDADIPCYVVHGNHDPLGAGAEKLPLPDNVHVFGADDVEIVLYPTDDKPAARIMGQSYGSQWESNALYYHYTPPDTAIPNIGLLHTGLDPNGQRYAPCGPSDLAQKDIDYWALGHIHTPRLVDGAPAAYAGIPQGRNVGETAVGGCLLVEVEAGSDPNIEFVPTSPIVWQEIVVDLETASTDGGSHLRNLADAERYLEERMIDLQNADQEALTDALGVPIADTDWAPEGFVCRWTLSGRGELFEALDEEATDVLATHLRKRWQSMSPFVWTESVRDHSAQPLPDLETLIESDEIISELVELTNEIREDDEAREELRGEAGDLWKWQTEEEHEDVPEEQLPLNDKRLDQLIDRALTRSIDELVTRRNNAN
ncbi:metallophosphoesterase family protein [Salinigranum halophilum]|uniref:metallophosphoesterase family protein n=1 Tax=Salinigranum halophilum TaxID=2565931 RepID=UPI0010A93D82|nr:DNA repair exonuclease [Salinigranum halophilum]